MLTDEILQPAIRANVLKALNEDVGTGDITAELIPEVASAHGHVITREHAVIAGKAWVDEVFAQVDERIELKWKVADGDVATPNTELFSFQGPARALLTAERTALNFLQTLSGTATAAHHYAEHVKDTGVTLLDTRKTIPGLRLAQKYAVTCGSCQNHRIGLYDMFLIKENHILACGGIQAAIETARNNHPEIPLEIEVENFYQLNEAITGGADIIMLDNFTPDEMRKAVKITAGKAKLEASGNITDETLLEFAKTGVDYISIGALTKHCRAVDLSMRFTEER